MTGGLIESSSCAWRLAMRAARMTRPMISLLPASPSTSLAPAVFSSAIATRASGVLSSWCTILLAFVLLLGSAGCFGSGLPSGSVAAVAELPAQHLPGCLPRGMRGMLFQYLTALAAGPHPRGPPPAGPAAAAPWPARQLVLQWLSMMYMPCAMSYDSPSIYNFSSWIALAQEAQDQVQGAVHARGGRLPPAQHPTSPTCALHRSAPQGVPSETLNATRGGPGTTTPAAPGRSPGAAGLPPLPG